MALDGHARSAFRSMVMNAKGAAEAVDLFRSFLRSNQVNAGMIYEMESLIRDIEADEAVRLAELEAASARAFEVEDE